MCVQVDFPISGKKLISSCRERTGSVVSETGVIVGKNGVRVVEVNFRDEFIIATMYFHDEFYGLVKRYLDYQLNRSVSL